MSLACRSPAGILASSYDLELLDPEWVATLHVYWRGQSPDQAAAVLGLVSTATREPTCERSIYLLQKGLRLLGLVELSIIRLIITSYTQHVQNEHPEPARHVARQVLCTLQAIDEGRARRRRGSGKVSERVNV